MSRDPSPDQIRQFAQYVVRKLRDAGYEALWAGGCVRDQLLGYEPSDYDVATSAKPDQVRHCFGRRRTLAIGASFGVITVRGRREQGQVEVATFRSDAQYSDGRHPDHVTFSNAREDAQRRDFTINGLFYDPLEKRVIDYVAGQQDLEAKVIRAIGEPAQRIAEDKLRMLRAVRFAATLDFHIDPATAEAVHRDASSLSVVSAERIAAELRKMLVHPNRARAVEMLHDLRLLAVILPESTLLFEPPGRKRSDECHATWETTLGLLKRLARPTFRVALAALLWGIHVRIGDPDSVTEICRRWRLSNAEQKGTAWMLAKQRFIRDASMTPWPFLQRTLIHEDVNELLELASAIAAQVDGDQRNIDYCHRKLQLPREQLDPPPLITGDDLQRAGWPAGPLFGRVLRRVRDAQLAEQIGTRDEAMQLAAKIFRQLDADS